MGQRLLWVLLANSLLGCTPGVWVEGKVLEADGSPASDLEIFFRHTINDNPSVVDVREPVRTTGEGRFTAYVDWAAVEGERGGASLNVIFGYPRYNYSMSHLVNLLNFDEPAGDALMPLEPRQTWTVSTLQRWNPEPRFTADAESVTVEFDPPRVPALSYRFEVLLASTEELFDVEGTVFTIPRASLGSDRRFWIRADGGYVLDENHRVASEWIRYQSAPLRVPEDA